MTLFPLLENVYLLNNFYQLCSCSKAYFQTSVYEACNSKRTPPHKPTTSGTCYIHAYITKMSLRRTRHRCLHLKSFLILILKKKLAKNYLQLHFLFHPSQSTIFYLKHAKTNYSKWLKIQLHCLNTFAY